MKKEFQFPYRSRLTAIRYPQVHMKIFLIVFLRFNTRGTAPLELG
jgi:hypothetical protein